MRKKLPMKGDPVPEWLLAKPSCSCTKPGTRTINGEWFCELCFHAGTEMVDLLSVPLKTRRVI